MAVNGTRAEVGAPLQGNDDQLTILLLNETVSHDLTIY